MKKIIALLLLVCMMLTALTACGGNETPNTDNPNNNSEESKGPTSNNDKKFEPETIPASNIDPRKVVIDYMYKMANLEWTPTQDIDFTSGENYITDHLIYNKGVKYSGIMYVTGNHCLSNYDAFAKQLNENNEYIGPIEKKTAWGNHCSSAIRVSYDQVEEGLKFGSTPGMVPSKKMGTLIVGDYKVEDSFTTTDEIIELNNILVMSEAYAQLQPGDCILTCWGPTGHARMVLEVKLEKSAAGKINTSRSGVVCIEQTSSFDKQRKDDVKTTWYVEHFYSFSELYEAKYVPLTIKTLQNIEKKDTTFTTKSLNTADNITSGRLKGIVRSSFLEIESATIEIIDKNGNVIVTDTIVNTNKDRLAFQFNNQKGPDELTTLAAGDYTYLVTANTTYGSAKVAMVDFSVN